FANFKFKFCIWRRYRIRSVHRAHANTQWICDERSSFTRADDMGRNRFPRYKNSPNFDLQMLSELKTIFSFSRTFHRSSEPVRGPEARWRLRKTRQALGPGPSVPRREYGRACENRGSRS